MTARFKNVGRESSRLRYPATHRVTFPLNQYTLSTNAVLQSIVN